MRRPHHDSTTGDIAAIASAVKHLRCLCNTSQSAGKAANQTSNKKLISLARPANLPVPPFTPCTVVRFYVWHIQRSECQQHDGCRYARTATDNNRFVIADAASKNIVSSSSVVFSSPSRTNSVHGTFSAPGICPRRKPGEVHQLQH